MSKSIFQKTVTRQQFFDRYDGKSSQKNARFALGTFDFYLQTNYHNVSETAYFDQLKNTDEHTLYTEVDRLVQFMYKDGVREKSRRKVSTGLSPAATRNYWNYQKAWFRANGIKTEDYLIKTYVKWPKQLKEKRQPLDKDTARKIVEALNPKYKIYYLFLLMTGTRLGKEALGVLVRDIDFESDPIKITIRAELAKTGTERVTFFPKSLANDLYLYNVKGKKDTDRVFAFTYEAFYDHFKRIREKLHLTDKYQNGWNYKINPYKARKYSRTRMSRGVDKDFAETIIGHEDISNLYNELSDDELATMYNDAIPELLLTDEQKLKTENDKLKKHVEDQEHMKLTLQKQADQIRRLEQMIENHKQS